MMVAQARLQSGTTRITAWVDLKTGVRVGAVVSLKDDERRWQVQSLGCPVESGEISNFGRRHREPHGGLQ